MKIKRIINAAMASDGSVVHLICETAEGTENSLTFSVSDLEEFHARAGEALERMKALQGKGKVQRH